MVDSVVEKLKAAEYFLTRLKDLERELGVLASAEPYIMRGLLDAFLFEVIAAKDFFLQEINNKFCLGLPSKEVSETALIGCSALPDDAKKQVREMWSLLSNADSWLWRLNNYRNVATHRHLIRRDFKVAIGGGGDGIPRTYLPIDPDDPTSKSLDKEVIPYCEESLTRMKKLMEESYSELGI